MPYLTFISFISCTQPTGLHYNVGLRAGASRFWCNIFTLYAHSWLRFKCTGNSTPSKGGRHTIQSRAYKVTWNEEFCLSREKLGQSLSLKKIVQLLKQERKKVVGTEAGKIPKESLRGRLGCQSISKSFRVSRNYVEKESCCQRKQKVTQKGRCREQSSSTKTFINELMETLG